MRKNLDSSNHDYGDFKMNVINSLKQEIRSLMINDSAHDVEHVMRVFKNAQKICKKENANTKLVLAAVLLHDVVSYPKSDKRSKLSSIKSFSNLALSTTSGYSCFKAPAIGAGVLGNFMRLLPFCTKAVITW